MSLMNEALKAAAVECDALKTERDRYRRALKQIIELGERHVEEAQMRRMRDFREAIKIAVAAVNGGAKP